MLLPCCRVSVLFCCRVCSLQVMVQFITRTEVQSSTGHCYFVHWLRHPWGCCSTLLPASPMLLPAALSVRQTMRICLTPFLCCCCFRLQSVTKTAGPYARPILFALSNPTDKSELTFEQAVAWSSGRAAFASGSPFPALQYSPGSSNQTAAAAAAAAGMAGRNSSSSIVNGSSRSRTRGGGTPSSSGRLLRPAQANNCLVFPGLGLGCIASGATRINDDMLLAAAAAIAGEHGALLPGVQEQQCRQVVWSLSAEALVRVQLQLPTTYSHSSTAPRPHTHFSHPPTHPTLVLLCLHAPGLTSSEELADDCILPDISRLPEVALAVASVVARTAAADQVSSVTVDSTRCLPELGGAAAGGPAPAGGAASNAEPVACVQNLQYVA
jgi:hypothetical protein